MATQTPALKFKNNKKLGNTGLYVSELCLGAMTLQKSEKGKKFGVHW